MSVRPSRNYKGNHINLRALESHQNSNNHKSCQLSKVSLYFHTVYINNLDFMDRVSEVSDMLLLITDSETKCSFVWIKIACECVCQIIFQNTAELLRNTLYTSGLNKFVGMEKLRFKILLYPWNRSIYKSMDLNLKLESNSSVLCLMFYAKFGQNLRVRNQLIQVFSLVCEYTN